MKRILILFLSFTSLLLNAQKSNKSPHLGKNDTIAALQIKAIKEYGLVVRLNDNSRVIANYRKAGASKIANQLEEKATLQNLKLMQALLTNFNFCQLQFILSKNTMALLNSDSLMLTSYTLKTDSAVFLSTDSLFFIEYGPLYGNEQVNEWSYKDYNKTQESNIKVSETALIIKDKKLQQLQSPFPYYEDVPLADPLNYIVTTYNKRLQNFYKKILKKEGKPTDETDAYWITNNPNRNLKTWLPKIEERLEQLKDKGPKFMKQG
jgi:hypothetical protein